MTEYISSDKIHYLLATDGQEHLSFYEFDEIDQITRPRWCEKEAEKMWKAMPPVEIQIIGGEWIFTDGNHRVNFCEHWGLDVPVTKKELK